MTTLGISSTMKGQLRESPGRLAGRAGAGILLFNGIPSSGRSFASIALLQVSSMRAMVLQTKPSDSRVLVTLAAAAAWIRRGGRAGLTPGRFMRGFWWRIMSFRRCSF